MKHIFFICKYTLFQTATFKIDLLVIYKCLLRTVRFWRRTTLGHISSEVFLQLAISQIQSRYTGAQYLHTAARNAPEFLIENT